MAAPKPIRILIAALGGDGGGVLASWIANAAILGGLHVQRTSIPGVAQRTGATTYYLELVPDTNQRAKPVLALNPAPGEVELVVASELLEATRTIQAGYVTPDRTLLIASTARVFTVLEKGAMGDGRYDENRMLEVARRFSQRAILADYAAAARDANSALNAVLFGAVAASGALPIDAERFRAAIRAEGKSLDANLRGFNTGFALATGVTAVEPAASQTTTAANELEAEVAKLVPPPAAEIAIEGIRRLADYQGLGYARLYLDRLRRFAARPGADSGFMRELARHLAVRMSFEDTIRVAQLKLRSDRIARLRREAKAGERDVIDVIEFMKPGPEEIFSLLPPALGRRVLNFVARRGWSDKSWAMRVSTTRFGGFIRLKFLAGLRSWRPRTLRYAEEQTWIEHWLDLVERALAVDPQLAREVTETARLVTGYGETYKRGQANWQQIARDIVEPALAGGLSSRLAPDAVLQCRVAALADPGGQMLAAVVQSVRSAEPRLAAE